VNFAAVTICVASQRVVVVVVVSLSTQSGNFWIHPRISSERNVSLAENRLTA
jgi:hypothetical protein